MWQNESLKYVLHFDNNLWLAELTTIDRRIDLKVTGVGLTEIEAIEDARRELQSLENKKNRFKES